MTKRKLSNGNYAAIDIGSNAVRLLIKRIGLTQNNLVSTKEQLIRVPLRLGFDVFTKGKLSKGKEKKLCKLVASFSDLMKLYDVIDYKACATSAIRDAENSKKVISLIKKKTGVKIHVLTGKEEAKLIYKTHSEFITDKKDDFIYVDVGGGSTEINLIIDSNLVFSNSYNIGTIRVLSDTVNPDEWTKMEQDLVELSHKYPKIDILGSGGNINKLYRLVENKDKKLQRMPVDSLKEIYESMRNMSLEERVKQYNLKYDRADVIVPACHVFLSIAELMESQFIYVPTIGLADGIIDDMILKKINKKKDNEAEAVQDEIRDNADMNIDNSEDESEKSISTEESSDIEMNSTINEK